MTQAACKFYHALGLRQPGGPQASTKMIEHLNDDTVVYLVGKHVTLFNYETKNQRFILKGSKMSEFLAFAVSSNRRYIALSYRLVDDGSVQVRPRPDQLAASRRRLKALLLMADVKQHAKEPWPTDCASGS